MITLADLTERFGKHEIAELTDREAFETINQTVVDKAIGDAESEIESYLNVTGLVGRNALGRLIYTQSATMPNALFVKACDIARYYLHEEGATAIVEKRYVQAVDWLKLVMRNPTMLTGVVAVENTNGGGIVVLANPVPSDWIT